MNYQHYPYVRLRRTRLQPWIRDLVQENHLRVQDLIWPVFIQEGSQTVEPIPSMPGIHRFTLDKLLPEVKRAQDLGIPLIALFPVVPPALKTPDGQEALNPHNLVCRAVRAIKQAGYSLGVMCDVALDPYTDHGHDGVFREGQVDNDATIDLLIQQALNQARAGCDVLAPSDMMDGRVGAIRKVLAQENFPDTLLMSYAAKYASAFYGPFRTAIGSMSQLAKKDKKTYQQNPANGDEALREVALDIQEGADLILIKPGLPYLDILHRVKTAFHLPTFAYQVSGEYAMIQAAGQAGYLDAEAALFESLLAFKRAGADGILTYAALWAAEQLNV